MVYAGAIDEYLLTVEHEAPLSIERECADAILRRLTVDGRAILLQLHLCLVECRTFWRPQLWIIHHRGCTDGLAFASLHSNHQLSTADHNGGIAIGLRLIGDGHVYLHPSFFGINLRRGGCRNQSTSGS